MTSNMRFAGVDDITKESELGKDAFERAKAITRLEDMRKHIDSYVALGVLSKRRSSSHKIQRVLRRFDALELASGVRPFFAYIRSSLNPADRPSRRPPVRRPAGESSTRKRCRRR